jgi:mitogen-activated protein kinase 1/3
MAEPDVPPGKVKFTAGGTTFIVDDNYEYIKKIGHGAYGVVVSAYDRKNNVKVAIKKVPKAFDDLVDAKRILREIRLLSFFDHENITSLLDIQRPPARTGYEDIYIITDLMETDMHRVVYSR